MTRFRLIFLSIILLLQSPLLWANRSTNYSLTTASNTLTYASNPDAYQLEPVIVSASTMSLSLTELAGSVTVITEKDMQDKKVHYLGELLNSQPGVDIISNGGVGQLSSVFIRGAASEQTLVLINGVPVNDPSTPARNTDIAQLTLDNVSKIEIVRGPQSILFGSSAMGGVINIITKQAQKTWTSRLTISGGTYQTLLTQLSAQGYIGQLGLVVGLSLNNTQGFSSAKRSKLVDEQASQPLPIMDNDGSRNLTLDLNLDYSLSEQLDFKLNNRYITSDNQLDNFGGEFGDDPNYEGKLRQVVNRFVSTYHHLPGWTQSLTVGLSQSDRIYNNAEDQDHVGSAASSEWRARTLMVDWRHELDIGLPWTTKLVIGGGYQQEQAMGHSITEYDDWYTFNHVIEENHFDGRSAHQFDIYAEHNLSIGGWTSLAGIRLDNHDQFSEFLAFKITEAYRFKYEQTKLSVSFGTAYKAPSLYQLYVDDTYSTGDSTLKPEQSVSWEIGLTQPLLDKKINLAIHYYQSSYKDQIDAPFNGTSFKYEYINVKKVEIQGVEASLTANLLDDLKLTLIYNKLTANDVTNKDTLGNDPLLRRADYKAGLELNWHWQDINLNMDFTYIGPRWDKVYDNSLFTTVQTSLSPYTMANLALRYRIIDHVECFIKIHNLFDTEYELVSGYNTSRFNLLVGTTLQW